MKVRAGNNIIPTIHHALMVLRSVQKYPGHLLKPMEIRFSLVEKKIFFCLKKKFMGEILSLHFIQDFALEPDHIPVILIQCQPRIH